jgi:hypothetical protein
MRSYVYSLSAVALFVACEQGQTTVIRPQKRKKIILRSVKQLAEKKESQTTIINPPATTEIKKENISSSRSL